MPDQSTGATALMAGEIDYQQYLPFDLLARLERARGVKHMSFGGVVPLTAMTTMVILLQALL